MQKARGQAFLGRSQGIALPLLVGIRFQVLFHSPHRGSFHLSLTVLVHYRSPGSIYPYEIFLVVSRGISRVPRYSGTRREPVTVVYRAVTVSGRSFQIVRLCDWLLTRWH